MLEKIKTKYPSVYYKTKTTKQTKKPEKVYYIQYRTPDGKQHHEKVGTSSTGMTDSKANQLRTQRMTGKSQTNTERRKSEVEAKKAAQGAWTIAKLWEEFQTVKADVKIMRHYRACYKLRLKDRFAKKEPHEIEPREIDRLKSDMKNNYKPATILLNLILLKAIVNFGVERRLCQPLQFKVKMPKVNNEKTEDLTKEQLASLLKTLDTTENVQCANMLKLVLFTGMRRGEILKLEWRDIDFEKGFIHLRTPKGGVDQKIPLNISAKELLEKHERIYPDSPFVFPGRYGKKRGACADAVRKIRDEAGLPKDFRPMHGLRHVYASMLASSGKVDMYTLQKLMTHKDPKMTQRYAHLRDEALQKASTVASDIIAEVGKG